MATRALNRAESGITSPLLPPQPAVEEISLGTRVAWGVVTALATGFASLGVYACIEGSTQPLDKATAVALTVASLTGGMFSLIETIKTPEPKAEQPIIQYKEDISSKPLVEILTRIDKKLNKLAKRYGHEQQKTENPLIQSILDKIKFIDALLDSTVQDRDHYKAELEQLQKSFGDLKKFMGKQTQESSPALSSAKFVPEVKPPQEPVTKSSSSPIDPEELAQRLLAEFESFESKVKISLSNPPSGRATPGVTTPVATTPTKPRRSALKTTDSSDVKPLRVTFAEPEPSK